MKSVVCFGEIVWDILPQAKHLGGAPYNVAYHLAHLGCAPRLVSAIGNDELGRMAMESARDHQIDTSLVVRHAALPTGTVTVSVDPQGQASYVIHEPVAWDNISDVPAANDHLAAVVYGSLALRSATNRKTLKAWLALPLVLRVCDLNLRPPFDRVEEFEEFIRRADILKLNQDEAKRLVPTEAKNATSSEHAERIARRFGSPVVCITLGADGAVLRTMDGTFSASSPRVVVKDTIGAGDAFTAALLAGRLASDRPDWQHVLERACALGAFVASHHGAQPEYQGSSPL